MESVIDPSTSSLEAPSVNGKAFPVRNRPAPQHTDEDISDLTGSDDEERIVWPLKRLSRTTREEASIARQSRALPTTTPPGPSNSNLEADSMQSPLSSIAIGTASATTNGEAEATPSPRDRSPVQRPAEVHENPERHPPRAGDDGNVNANRYSQHYSDPPFGRDPPGPSSSTPADRQAGHGPSPGDAELIDTYVARVLDTIPDVDLDLATHLILHHLPTSQDKVVESVVSALCDSDDEAYPAFEPKGKGKAPRDDSPEPMQQSPLHRNGDLETNLGASNDPSSSEESDDGRNGLECGCCFASFPVVSHPPICLSQFIQLTIPASTK